MHMSDDFSYILVWNGSGRHVKTYSFGIFYTHLEYSKWVWKVSDEIILTNEYRIFQMSMKRNLQRSQNDTHSEYSILISFIPNAYGQAYLYGISEMSMNTWNVKKRKNWKIRRTDWKSLKKKQRADSIQVWKLEHTYMEFILI